MTFDLNLSPKDIGKYSRLCWPYLDEIYISLFWYKYYISNIIYKHQGEETLVIRAFILSTTYNDKYQKCLNIVSISTSYHHNLAVD